MHECDEWGIPLELEEEKKRYWITHVVKGSKKKFIEVFVQTKEKIGFESPGGKRVHKWKVEEVGHGHYEIGPDKRVIPHKVDVTNGDNDLESKMSDYASAVASEL